MCLTETFIDDQFDTGIFPEHIVYESKATRYSKYGRALCGLMVLVRKELQPFVKKIDISISNLIAILLDPKLTGSEKCIVYLSCYLPPNDSIYWNNCTHGKGPECLEEAVLEIHDQVQNFNLILNGDFNSRTGCKNIRYNDPDDPEHEQENEIIDYSRKSEDQKTNAFGENLLELCQMTNCAILNGLNNYGTFDGAFTYVSKQGASTVDYFLASLELIQSSLFTSLRVGNRIESDHMPVELEMNCQLNKANVEESKPNTIQEKYIWTKCKEELYVNKLYSDEILSQICEAAECIANNCDEALQKFTNCILSASSCMKRRIGGKMKIQKNEWFDNECAVIKKNTLRMLKNFRNLRTEDSKNSYIEAKKLYRKLTKSKRRDYNVYKANTLANQMKFSNKFWKNLKSLYNENKKNDKTEVTITCNEWYSHFQSLFKSEHVINSTPPESKIDEDIESTLNQTISENEVSDSICRLKTGKASGLDDINAEMLKSGGRLVIIFLTRLFNKVFESGCYPREWTKSIIIPIYKKGDKTDVDNYRGISLTSILSKCYVSIINKRIYNWMETYDKISESQAGFRRHYSTIDHIYTLTSIIQERLSIRKQKLYVAFVDLRKAFDMISHSKLLNTIYKDGIRGKIYCTIKAMYESLISCVRVNNNSTDFFQCEKGVRQGCNLSPTLFTLYINKLATYISLNEKHGYMKLPGFI